ncbi:Protein hgh1 [Blastocladiella emersonii ATCC 22665]|nr:Protein hgh1 [Blastocladiella emersonii ATCC 22665]
MANAALASQLDELIEFLGHEQDNLRQVASEYIAGISGGDASGLLKDTASGRLPRLLAALDKLLTDEPAISHLAIKTLINLTKDRTVLPSLNNPEFLFKLMTLILTPASVLADLVCMLLSNLSHDGAIARTLLRLAPLTAIKAPPVVVQPEHEVPKEDLPRVRFLRKSVEMLLAQPSAMDQLVEVFGRGVGLGGDRRWYNAQADFHFLASVFANVSQHSEGRAYFLTPIVNRYPEAPKQTAEEPETKKPKTEPSSTKKAPRGKTIKADAAPAAAPATPETAEGSSLASTTAVLSETDPTSALSKILCFTDHPELIRRGGVISALKNVTFDLRAHGDLLDAKHPNYVLHPLLTPLAPADLADSLLETEDDLDTVPDWLLSLPTDHFVEPVVDLRQPLLEALLVLATTRRGRDALRAAGTYLVVRAYHQAEDHVPCRLVAERLVDMLMREERADGAEDNIDALLPAVEQVVPDKELEALVSGELDIEYEYVPEDGSATAAPRKSAAAASSSAPQPMDEDSDDDDMVIEEIV